MHRIYSFLCTYSAWMSHTLPLLIRSAYTEEERTITSYFILCKLQASDISIRSESQNQYSSVSCYYWCSLLPCFLGNRASRERNSPTATTFWHHRAITQCQVWSFSCSNFFLRAVKLQLPNFRLECNCNRVRELRSFRAKRNRPCLKGAAGAQLKTKRMK